MEGFSNLSQEFGTISGCIRMELGGFRSLFCSLAALIIVNHLSYRLFGFAQCSRRIVIPHSITSRWMVYGVPSVLGVTLSRVRLFRDFLGLVNFLSQR